jgi:hypothetical protein
MIMRNFRVLAAALLLAVGAVQPAFAQATPVDPRWQAFLGCWAPVTQDGAQPVPEHVVCFRPADGGAVAALSVADDVIRSEELIRADGGPRPVREESCTGTETASWSEDGARLYLRSTLQCGDDVLGRESAGILALAGGGTFVDVQAVGVDDQYGIRTLQYRALSPAEYPAGMRALAQYGDDATRLYAAAPLSLEDIVEAGRVLPTEVVQAMLVSLPATRLHVDADALLALEEAGVEPEVIDVIVALAHPDRFAVGTAPLAGEEDADQLARREWMSDPYHDPWLRYSRYGYDPYYYSPFGYDRYGWGGYGYGGGTVIIVDRDDVDDDESAGRAAVIKGGGYTRIGPRPGSGTDSYQPRSSVDRSAPSRGSSAAPSRGSSSTTRKAKPKGSGGGGI